MQGPYLIFLDKVAYISCHGCGLLGRIEKWDSPQVSRFTSYRNHRSPGILVSLTNQRDTFYALFEEIREKFQVAFSLKIQKVNQIKG